MTGSGTVWARYTYDAWGKQLQVLNGENKPLGSTSDYFANANPFRYRGYYCDVETGFYYLQSRYYDPNIGRFINVDGQIETNLIGGLNTFSYCGNNPTVNSDPDGNCYYNSLGVWSHDNWEYSGGYIMKPEPATYLGNTQSGNNVYMSDTTNYSTAPNSIKVVVNYNKSNPELQTYGTRSDRELQSEINNLIITSHSLSTYHWKGGPTYYDANWCYQKALFCAREAMIFSENMAGVDYGINKRGTGYCGYGLVISWYIQGAMEYYAGYVSGRGVFRYKLGLQIIQA